ncbi:hypothetical protein [Rhizobium binae]|uniref:hypothetical protein n=1 Tax=Rhizobium binae TaxID=1138190 RepID=UPI001C83D904|nr:hypothetical protein [Rhizobium binae]MBX4926018.1 hypothetical protein [Rhizobium binae]
MPSIFEAKLGSMRHRPRSAESDDRHGERGEMEPIPPAREDGRIILILFRKSLAFCWSGEVYVFV